VSKIEQKKNFRVLEKLVDSDKLVFVFTAMGTGIPIYRLFVRALNKRGYSVVIYDYPAALVLNAEFDTYEHLYHDLKRDAYARIKNLKTVGVKHIYAYGVSMGTILASRLTRDTPEIHHVVMSMTYGDITTNMMQSSATAKTRKAMQAKGLTDLDLRRAVKLFNPIENTEGLRSKKVWLHLGRRDKILDYKITIKTKEAFEAAKLDFKYTESKYLGHYGTGAIHMLNVGELDKFYKS
jgi:hypothetical protein